MTVDTRAEHVRPREPATGTFEGEPFVVNPSEVFAIDHPLVRAYPKLFKPLEPTRTRPVVEQMTAAPGEKRGPGRPRKATAE
jgi:hypothetical protein